MTILITQEAKQSKLSPTILVLAKNIPMQGKQSVLLQKLSLIDTSGVSVSNILSFIFFFSFFFFWQA
jgi:hypothetical protein